jgi:hypothetical protein
MRISRLTQHVQTPRKNAILRARTVCVVWCKGSTQKSRRAKLGTGPTVSAAREGPHDSSSEPSATVIKKGSQGFLGSLSCLDLIRS